jgi:hypothetical protein
MEGDGSLSASCHDYNVAVHKLVHSDNDPEGLLSGGFGDWVLRHLHRSDLVTGRC